MKKLTFRSFLFLLGWIPLMLLYMWFENLRATPTANFSTLSTASSSASWLLKVPVGVLIEGLQFFDINGQRVNMESIDVPYISALGPTNAKASYKNWGGINKDPWKTWHIHTQMYERIPDFWWIRNLYYWDVPKSWILLMFSLNLLGFIIFGVKLNNLK